MDHQLGTALDTLHSLHTLLTQANPTLDVHARLEGVLNGLVASLGGVEREGNKASGELSQGLLSHVSQPRGAGTNPRLYLKRQLESVVEGSGSWEKRSRMLGGVMAGLGKEGGGGVYTEAPPPPPPPGSGGMPPPIITATGLSKVWGSVYGAGGGGGGSSSSSSSSSKSPPPPPLPPCDDELHARLLHPPTLEYLHHLGPGTGHAALREVLTKPYHGRPCVPLSRDDLSQFFRVFTAEEMEAGEAARAALKMEEERAAQMERERRIMEEAKNLGTSSSSSSSSSSFSSASFSAPPPPVPSTSASATGFAAPFSSSSSSSFSSFPAGAPPPPSDDRDRVLEAAIAAGTAGELVLGWEKEVFAALEAALPQGSANAEACKAAGEKEFATQFKRSGCLALVGRISALRWRGEAGGLESNPFLYRTDAWRTWGFVPEYGSVIEEGRMMDLVRIEKRCAIKKRAKEGGLLVDASEPYTPETLLADIATMAANALYYYRPVDCTPPFPSVVAAAAACARGDTGELRGLFPPPDTLPPGFSPVRNQGGFPVGGELTYRAAWEVALACGAMWGEIQGAREYYHRRLLRASWTAVLLPESLKWYQGGKLQEACTAGERERAVKGGYIALVDINKTGR